MHPLDPDDAAVMAAVRTMVLPMKGTVRGIEARQSFDTIMENVRPRNDVTFEAVTVGELGALGSSRAGSI